MKDGTKKKMVTWFGTERRTKGVVVGGEGVCGPPQNEGASLTCVSTTEDRRTDINPNPLGQPPAN